MREFVSVYLVGIAVFLGLHVVNILLRFIVTRLTGDYIYFKNLEKIGIYRHPFRMAPTTEKPETGAHIFVFGISLLLSWITVLFEIYEIAMVLFGFIASLVRSEPELFKQIAYPLRRNQNLTREAAFARFAALGIVAGTRTTPHGFVEELRDVATRVPSFDCRLALQILRELGVIRDATFFENVESLLFDSSGNRAS